MAGKPRRKRSGSNFLNDRKILQKDLKAGTYADGGGLYLKVDPGKSRTWAYRFVSPVTKKRRWMGLGSIRTLGLADARERARECRMLVLDGYDPIDHRVTEKANRIARQQVSITFAECSEKYIAAHEPSWKSPKQAPQWRSSLTTYAYPVIGELDVSQVETAHVMKIVEPIWITKTETASRVRSRIERVLGWATTAELRKGDNPARWSGHLINLLPASSKVKKVTNFPSMPYAELGAFNVDLRKRKGLSARALEFLILTAVRTSNVRFMRWGEVAGLDGDKPVWSIPADSMKMARPHNVPLSRRVVEILREAQAGEMFPDGEALVFPGGSANGSFSENAFLEVLKRMKRSDVTVHGFRATFKTWANETTAFPNEVIEVALAHAVGSSVEQAYMRGDMVDKRRALMDAWAVFCATVDQGAHKNVVPMNAAR